MFDCMEDCIHLKACRRIQKIGKSHWLQVPRYCTEDCSAYEPAPKSVEPVYHFELDVYGGDGITKCPSCGERLDTWCQVWLGEVQNENPPDYCPHCGVKLDWKNKNIYWNAGPNSWG